MADNKDSLYNDLFDVNGDGKVDDVDWLLDYQMYKMATDESADEPTQPIHLHPAQSLRKLLGSVHSLSHGSSVMPPLPKTLTREGYRYQRRAFASVCGCLLLLVVLFCFLPAAMAWASIVVMEENRDGTSTLLAVLITGGGLLFIGYTLAEAISGVIDAREHLRRAKELYLQTAPAEDLAQDDRKKTHSRTVWGIVLTGLIVLFIAVGVHAANLYGQAEKLIDAGQYAEAEELLEKFRGKGYKDADSLLLLCRARQEFAKGHVSAARYTMRDVRFYHQSPEQNEKIEAFRERLKLADDRAMHEWYVRDQQKRETQITTGVPFVGMSEYRINDTSLGAATLKGHNYEISGSERQLANLYDFYQNGKVVFSARCINGTVTQVWDKR